MADSKHPIPKPQNESGILVHPPIPSIGHPTELGMPVGSIIAFAGEIRQKSSDDSNHQTNLFMFNWLLCDGTEIAISQYPALFAALGFRYGGSTSSNTFALPNYQGTFLRGVDNNNVHAGSVENRTAPASGGTNTVGSTQDDALRNHKHNYDYKQAGEITPAELPPTPLLNVTDTTRPTSNPIDVDENNLSSQESRPVNTFVYWLVKANY